jgi:general secretion pathway protein K
MAPGYHRDRTRGVALVAVLCLVSFMAVLAVGALEATRRHGQLAHRSFELLQASELADSAIRVAVLDLAAPNPQGRALGNPIMVQVFSQSITVRWEREAGRVDLNAADQETLASALVDAGLDRSDAAMLAARIADWRDTDDESVPQGAERAEYRRAGRSSGPRNAPFETTAELRQVLGAERVPDEILNALTVYSHLEEVRKVEAAAEAVPGALAGESMRLHACAVVAGTKACRTAIVRLTGNGARPALVYAWHTAPT